MSGSRSSPVRRTAFPLNDVRLLSGPFARAQETALEYLLALDADRLCAPYLAEAGLAGAVGDPGAAPYGSWESDGMGGHMGGHYLSSLARFFAATGDSRVRSRLDHVLDVFERCQGAAGNGYLGGIPRGQQLGRELAAARIEADLFILNGRWVPLYSLHKTLAGLLDAFAYVGSQRALSMASALGQWWVDSTSGLPDAAFESVLTTEYGGMNDAFALLYTATGRSCFLTAAHRFSHRRILEPLAAGRDELDGLHANTQIPKVVGYARLAGLTGNRSYAAAAETFWTTVRTRRTVSIGGNSVREHFHPSGDFSPMVTDVQGPETCNTYNMLKLAQLRFEQTGDPAALEYYERALCNHILSSQRPGTGGFAYFTPMRPGHYRVYSQPQESMWCCAGSGLENHSRYGELIFSRSAEALEVNLYIAAELECTELGLRLHLEADLMESDTAVLTVHADEPLDCTLRLRRPGWATDMQVEIDGVPLAFKDDTGCGPASGSGNDAPGVRIRRRWSGTSVVTVRFAAEIRAEYLPDGSPWVSFVYGATVLAARVPDSPAETGTAEALTFDAEDTRMGHVASGPKRPLASTPVVTAARPAAAAVVRTRSPLTAELSAWLNGASVAVELVPFAGLSEDRYTVYFPAGTDPQAVRSALLSADRAEAAAFNVIDAVAAGEQQPEADHGFAGEGTTAGGDGTRHWRSASGWFSYLLTDPDGRAQTLRLIFQPGSAEGARVEINGVHTSPDALPGDSVPDAAHEYQLPAVRPGNGAYRVRITARPGGGTGNLLQIQLLGAPAAEDS